MSDMLVKLYELPSLEPLLARSRQQGVEVRKPIGPEARVLVSWVEQHFGDAWAAEVQMALANRPISCFIAVDVAEREIVGFACYDATVLGYFGPTGVAEEARGRGLGQTLLLAALHGMRSHGYAYAIIGAAGPKEFYERVVGAVSIPDSSPGIYKNYVRKKSPRQ